MSRLGSSVLSSASRADVAITNWLARYGVGILRVSLGVVFLWFGALKFFPGFSSAEELATRTIETLTFGLLQPSVSIVILATWECLIGIGLLLGVALRAVLLLLMLQMAGTVTPVFLFPEEVFVHVPYAPTFEGQYIIKNVVLIAAGLVIGSTVRGGRVIANPEVARAAGRVDDRQN